MSSIPLVLLSTFIYLSAQGSMYRYVGHSVKPTILSVLIYDLVAIMISCAVVRNLKLILVGYIPVN